MIEILAFDNDKHRTQVIALWDQIFGYEAPHNASAIMIDKKIAVEDDLFFVAVQAGDLIGTVMAGYDGHRGWIYLMAVHPDRQNQGIGTKLLRYAERRLESLGCMKINLQIMSDNESVQNFYESLGYTAEKRISMGKRLKRNISST